jgi:uncharacterized protein (DUF433 family)
MSERLVVTDPEVMGGTPVFAGTRVPIQTLIDYLQADETIEDFLDGFPTVTREQVLRFLEAARDRLAEPVR